VIRQDRRWQALAPADDCCVGHGNSQGLDWCAAIVTYIGAVRTPRPV